MAWLPLGWEPAFFAETDPAPCAVLAHRHRGVPNLGDFREITDADAGSAGVDVLVGGTPCFPAGVVVLTDRGLVDIAEVVVGDMVLTHKGRYRHVLATGAKVASTITVRGQGHHGLETTAEHPFFAGSVRQTWVPGSKRVGGPQYRRVLSDPDWVEARDLAGKFWTHHTAFPAIEVPPMWTTGRETPGFPLTPGLCWILGCWLGDGWTTITRTRGFVYIASDKADTAMIATRLDACGIHHGWWDAGATDRFQICHRAMARWIRRHFGAYCEGKTVPAWLLGLDAEHRRAFLDGYIFADGNPVENGWSASSVGHRVAIGIKMVAHSLGFSVTICKTSPNREVPGKAVIEGRVVNEQPCHTIKICTRPRSSFESGGLRYGLVREIRDDGRKQVVHNLEVDEDSSYTADGLLVHNCQSFSVAGLRGGLGDDRGNLAIEFLRLVDRLRPRWVVWENVPGVLSSTSHHAADPVPPPDPVDLGRDGQEVVVEEDYDSQELHAFNCFLAGLSELGYGWSYRILDAQFVGGCDLHGHWRGRGPVPQRRRRVFVVAHSGDRGRLAGPPSRDDVARFSCISAAVLLEREGLFGDRPPRRAAEPAVAPGVTPGARRASGNRSGEQLTVEPAGGVPATATAITSVHAHQGVDSNCTTTLIPTVPATFQNTGQGWWNDADVATTVRTPEGSGSLEANLVAAAVGGVAPPLVGKPWSDRDCQHDRLVVADTLQGHHPRDREDATYVAVDPPAGPLAFGGNNTAGPIDVATARSAHGGPHGRLDFESETFVVAEAVAHTLRGEGHDAAEDGTGRGIPVVVAAVPVAFGSKEGAQDAAVDLSPTLRAGQTGGRPNGAAPPAVTCADVIPIDMRLVSRGESTRNERATGATAGGAPGLGVGEPGDPAPTFGLSHPPAVARPYIVNAAYSGAKESHARAFETARCLDSNGSFATNQGGTVVSQPMPSEPGSPVAFNVIGDGQRSPTGAYLTEFSGCVTGDGLNVHGGQAGTLVAETVRAVDLQSLRMGGDVSYSLDTTEPVKGGGQAVFDPAGAAAVACDLRSSRVGGDVAPTVQRGPHGEGPHTIPHVIAFQERSREAGRTLEHQADLAYSVNAPEGGGRQHELNIATRTAVRRLTPVECERLMSFPDDYTLVPTRPVPRASRRRLARLRAEGRLAEVDGVPWELMADGPRYKCIGNSMATNVMSWIGQRIDLVERILEEAGGA